MTAQQHRAGVTNAHAAAELGAFEVQDIAQYPQKRGVRRYIHRRGHIADIQLTFSLKGICSLHNPVKGERIGHEHRLSIGVYRISIFGFQRGRPQSGNPAHSHRAQSRGHPSAQGALTGAMGRAILATA